MSFLPPVDRNFLGSFFSASLGMQILSVEGACLLSTQRGDSGRRLISPESRTSQELTSEKRAGFRGASWAGSASSALELYRQAFCGV